ncbi:MAG: hypothetical protein WC526_01755 [Patescibacteria group bacterium]
MFKHDKIPEQSSEAEKKTDGKDEAKIEVAQPKKEESLEDLVRKNLKWSQIIYEQNRKINNKLLWSAVVSWLYFILIVAPLILGIIFLPPLIKNVWSQYGDLLGGITGTTQNSGSSQSTIDSFIKMLNLDPAKQAQVKALINK